MDVIYTYCNKELNDECFNELILKIPIEKQKRIKGYRYKKSAQNSLFGEILLRYNLERFWGLNEHIRVISDRYGKPFLESHKNIHFNLSHTDNCVACATAKEPVGVDVEMVKPIEIDLADRFFTSNECDYIDCGLDEYKLERFYRIWTRKESYVKMLGKGLFVPLNSFEVLENKDMHYEEFLFTDEVIGTVCSRKKEIVRREEVDMDTLIDWFLKVNI